jgi:hypothetical protein
MIEYINKFERPRSRGRRYGREVENLLSLVSMSLEKGESFVRKIFVSER